MGKKIIFSLSIFAGLLFFVAPKQVEAVSSPSCYCEFSDKVTPPVCENVTADQCPAVPNAVNGYVACVWLINPDNSDACAAAVVNFKAGGSKSPLVIPDTKIYPTIGKFIPGCVNEKSGVAYLASDCGNITIFLDLAFAIINYLFGIIGGIALLYFIYGGFILILSQGNSEKVELGKAIVFSAVLGIVIAFSGYALIQFVGTVAGIKQEYQITPTATK